MPNPKRFQALLVLEWAKAFLLMFERSDGQVSLEKVGFPYTSDTNTTISPGLTRCLCDGTPATDRRCAVEQNLGFPVGVSGKRSAR